MCMRKVSMELPALTEVTLHKRYKRFLADVELPDGSVITAHCPNTGAMTGCAEPMSRAWISTSDNPKRKLAYTLELVAVPEGRVCVHSAFANKVVGEALRNKVIEPLAAYEQIKPEAKLTDGSRADFLLTADKRRIFVEVKSVTLHQGDGLGLFPDAVSERARKHVVELADSIDANTRAALIFCVLHDGIKRVAPAKEIDPAYANALADAVTRGLEVYALGCDIADASITAHCLLPVEGVQL